MLRPVPIRPVQQTSVHSQFRNQWTEEDSLVSFEKTISLLQQTFEGSEFANSIYLVGGCVRDRVLNREPEDIDLMVLGTNDSGIRAATFAAKQLGIYAPGSNPVVYPRFGTALVHLKDRLPLEFVGVEVGPDGEESALLAEARRRDFTINTLAQRLFSDEIIDPLKMGLTDVEARRIVTPIDPNLTFDDDPLRLVRAARFANSYGFELDPQLIGSMRSDTGLIKLVSAERIRTELSKVLVSDSPGRGLRLLQDTGVLEEILPEVTAMGGVTQNRFHHGDVLDHSLAALDSSPPRLLVRIAALFHDVGKVATRTEVDGKVQFIGHERAGARTVRSIMRRLKFGNSDIQAVSNIIAHHMDLKIGGPDSSGLKDRQLRRFINQVGSLLDDSLDTIHADNVSHAPEFCMPDQVRNIRRRISDWDLDRYVIPVLPIDGNDAIAVGAKGRRIGEILNRITRKYLDNDGISRETAIRIATDMANDRRASV